MRKLFKALLLLTALISILSVSVFATGAEGVEAADTNVFETLYRQALKHSDKILSALAFGGTVVLTIFYRKGLLPIMRGGLNALGATVKSLKEEAEKLGTASSERLALATEKLEAAENTVSLLTEKLEALEAELESVNKTNSKYSDIKTVMKYQIDMLYEVFMSSSLPLYQKEAVGEKITEMKQLLVKTEEVTNE